MDEGPEILKVVQDIRELLRLVAEPAVAERDRKLRAGLRKVVGRSGPGKRAVLLMDGTRSQAEIYKQAGINQGQLSTLVKNLESNKLLEGGSKQPKLAVSILANFFEQEVNEGG